MRWARMWIAPAVLMAATVGCKGKPVNAADWAEQVEDGRKIEDKLDAIRQLRRLKDKVGVPALSKALDNPRLREEAAFTLGEIGDPSAADALIEAIDYSAAGGDEANRLAVKANAKIAGALGLLGDKKATPSLIKLLKNRDPVTRVEAIKALALLGDKSAVGPLAELAADQKEEPFINKTAIVALGNFADPAGLPAVMKMLFHERRGISFYAESSYSAFQIGPEAVDPLVKVLEGKDKDLEKWADENAVKKAALYIKSAALLGDLGDARAVKPLIGRLGYKDDLYDMELLVRTFSATALGRLFAKPAAGPIAAMLDVEEANVRMSYVTALVLIGDKSVLPKMMAAARNGSWDARSMTMAGITQLGGEKEIAGMEALLKFEKDKGMPVCMEDEQEGEDKAARQKRCEGLVGERQKGIRDHMARLVAAKECKESFDCWLGKLKDPTEWRVRERAAYELGRLGDAKALPALLAQVNEEQLDTRYAIVTSIEKLAPKDTATAKAAAPKLAELLEKERGKAHFVKINEDVKRLEVKLRRL